MLFVFACLALLSFINGETIKVTTTLGEILGVKLTSRLDNDFYAFRGIRYAEPPINELRFLNPKPVKAWKPEVFNATIDGPMCPQSNQDVNNLSEDCLRINIYTKDLSGCKPVIVYLHPGGFYVGTGQSKTYAGPLLFMDRDIVFVTINYRLGTLGFLATDTANAPGNAGLKDQVEALRWIQKHIHNFGGDANSVTLLGYSAGSFSIGLHMISPMSRGLFHRGIAMSASPFGQFKYETKDLRLAERQAKLLNCSIKTLNALIDCLKDKPMIDYANTLDAMFDFKWNPVLNWMPVIETDFGQERFIIEDPYKTVLSGDFYKVPLITGITEYEFVSLAHGILSNATTLSWFNENFEKYAPITLLYERDTENSQQISRAFRRAYLNDTNLSFPESLDAFGKLCSDGVIGFEYYRFLDIMSRFTPVYTYLFTYKGRYSNFKYPANITYGAVHHDELIYLLSLPEFTPLFKKTDPENDLIERLTRMFTEFAKKSNPNNVADEYLKDLNWPLYNRNKKTYLEINDNLILRDGGIYEERFDLWNQLFPLPCDKH